MSAAARKDGPEGIVSFAARGDNVTIRVSGYLFADAEHARDANALTGTVNLRAGAFGGSYRAMFHTWDFAELRDRLAEMHDDPHGEARFDTLEHLLEMVFRGDGRGDFTIAGKATDDPAYGNRLLFELAVDRRRGDDLDAALERRDRTVARQRAFGEDADEFAVGQRRVDVVEGLLHQHGILLRTGDRDRLRRAENPAETGRTEDLPVHDEADRTRHGRTD